MRACGCVLKKSWAENTSGLFAPSNFVLVTFKDVSHTQTNLYCANGYCESESITTTRQCSESPALCLKYRITLPVIPRKVTVCSVCCRFVPNRTFQRRLCLFRALFDIAWWSLWGGNEWHWWVNACTATTGVRVQRGSGDTLTGGRNNQACAMYKAVAFNSPYRFSEDRLSIASKLSAWQRIGHKRNTHSRQYQQLQCPAHSAIAAQRRTTAHMQ